MRTLNGIRNITGRLRGAGSGGIVSALLAPPGARSLLVFDPAISGTMDTQQTWKHEASQTHYQSVTNAAFNTGATTGKMSVEFWIRKGDLNNTGAAANPIRCHMNRSSGATLATTQWVIGGRDSPTRGTDSLYFGLYNSTAVGFAYAHFNIGWSADSSHINVPLYSHVVWVYDGAGATDADRLKLYLNGAQQTLQFTSGVAIPATMVSLTTPALEIGRARVVGYGVVATRYLSGDSGNASRSSSLGPTRLYSDAISGSVVASLYNSGRPKLYSEMTTTERAAVVASYEWGGANGEIDASGNGYTLTPSGTQRIATVVLGVRDLVDGEWWRPYYAGQMQAYSINGAAAVTTMLGSAVSEHINYGAAPELIAVGSAYAVRCRGTQHLRRRLPASFARDGTFDIYHATALEYVGTNDASAELFGLMSGSTATQNDYAAFPFTSVASSTRRWSTRARIQSAAFNDQDCATATIPVDGTWKVARTTNPGGTSTWTMRTNGVNDSMVDVLPLGNPATVQQGFEDYTAGAFSHLVLHGFLQDNVISGGAQAMYGTQAVYSPKLPTATAVAVESAIRTAYGV